MAGKQMVEQALVTGMEDPGISWCDLVAACKQRDPRIRRLKIDELVALAAKSQWTHTLWDGVVDELETQAAKGWRPEVNFVHPWDSSDEEAVSGVQLLSRGYGPAGERGFGGAAYGSETEQLENSQWD